MVVRLRLAMHGKRNERIFHLVAINSRKRRNAKPIEKLGVFDPRPQQDGHKLVEWDAARIKQWLDHGAQPSDRFVQLMELSQLLPPDSPWHSSNRILPQLQVRHTRPSAPITPAPSNTREEVIRPPEPSREQTMQEQIAQTLDVVNEHLQRLSSRTPTNTSAPESEQK